MNVNRSGGNGVAGKQVALIRGINVGRAKRVAMGDLRALMEDLGCSQVQTLLNSGNVIFSTPEEQLLNAATSIEEALISRIGVAAKVIVVTGEEFNQIVVDNPLVELADDPSRLLVAVFGNSSVRARLKPLEEQAWAPESFAVGERAAYLWCPEGVLASPLAKELGKLLGDEVTTRNWSTILKIFNLTKMI